MRIARTLPPAANPLRLDTLRRGLAGALRGRHELERLRSDLQNHFQAAHCALVSSGKAALTLALSALRERYPERDQVLIPAYTCYSVPSAVVRAGLQVQLADIDPDSFDFDYHRLGRRLRNPRLLAVVPCHLYGRPADVPRLRAQIVDPQVTVIEDAAQAFGSSWRGRPLGTYGDIGIFSLGRGKALSTVAGGILLTNRDDLATLLRRHCAELPPCRVSSQLRLVGYALALMLLQQPAGYWLPSLLPWLRLGETIFDPEFAVTAMSPFQAGLARDWRDRLADLQKVRRRLADFWLDQLDRRYQPQLKAGEDQTPDWLRLPLLVGSQQRRDQLLQQGQRRGLGLEKGYPDAVAGIAELEGSFDPDDFRNARRLARHLLTLPLHPYVKNADLHRLSGLLAINLPKSVVARPANRSAAPRKWGNAWHL